MVEVLLMVAMSLVAAATTAVGLAVVVEVGEVVEVAVTTAAVVMMTTTRASPPSLAPPLPSATGLPARALQRKAPRRGSSPFTWTRRTAILSEFLLSC